MEHGEDANIPGYDLVNNKIGEALDNEFPRAINLPDPAQHGLRLKHRNRLTNRTHHMGCCYLVALIEPCANRTHVFARGRSPDNFHSRSNSENMTLTSSSVKSREARARATFSSSHANSRT